MNDTAGSRCLRTTQNSAVSTRCALELSGRNSVDKPPFGRSTMVVSRPCTYVTDLTNCLPQSAVVRAPRQSHWQAIPYEAEGVSGTLLVADANCQAPPLTIPLGVRGWHA